MRRSRIGQDRIGIITTRTLARKECLLRRHGLELTASRRGQDKRGRHRSAAIPPNELSWENVGKVWQSVAKYGKAWQQHVATCAHLKQSKLWQDVGDSWPFCENPVCPDPVRKPVIEYHYPKYDDNVCSKLFRSQEQKKLQKLFSAVP